MTAEKILIVDDEQNILECFRRMLCKRFQVDTACGPKAGFTALADSGPYAVVVSDMNMPELNGVRFLASVRQQSPDTVCILLSGKSGQQEEVDATAQGQIFRSLNKPCPFKILIEVLNEALAQHRLTRDESLCRNRK